MFNLEELIILADCLGFYIDDYEGVHDLTKECELLSKIEELKKKK